MAVMDECNDNNLMKDKVGYLDISEFLNIYAMSGRPAGMEVPTGEKRTEIVSSGTPSSA